MCRTVFKILKDKDQSEDIAQEAFFAVWEKKSEITTAHKSYLYKAAINKSFNQLLKTKRFIQTKDGDLTDYAPVSNNTEEQVVFWETEKEINTAIDALSPACKAIFIMSRTDGMSYKEIGEVLSISVKTVENQMSKALKLLRERLLVLFGLLLLNYFTNF